jgi:hypothetical protein
VSESLSLIYLKKDFFGFFLFFNFNFSLSIYYFIYFVFNLFLFNSYISKDYTEIPEKSFLNY